MSEERPDEFIDFSAKYKEWVAIKRLGITGSTKPEEIAYHLAGIRSTVDSKAFKILGIDTDAIDEKVKSLLLGKGASAVSQAIMELEKPEFKKLLSSACQSQTLAPFAKTYALNRLINHVGYETSLSQLALSKVFKELKPPKAPGRFGKGLKPKA
ncbi:DUF2666 domain-containing protein [Candidatus Marsarchaeota archaeon]|nr:DUF2666 domain-containing protein [Candidatus Marsarchaeota archaeon]